MAGGAGSFNGGDLVRESKNGVVTVIIQYRLGIFGADVTYYSTANVDPLNVRLLV